MKNQCSGCGCNFATETLFADHRVGEFSGEKAQRSPRRCLTAEEMTAKGWILRTIPAKVWVDGTGTRVPMETWTTTASYAAFQRMSEMGKTQGVRPHHRGGSSK